MTIPIDQQIALTSGADFWHTHAVPAAGLPEVMITDGPHGVRKQSGGTDHIGLNESVPSTCFPPAVALASTWNREVVRRVGEALGAECRALDVGILLGPGVNLKRSPLCGRNFEYFSEDPLLSGELAVPFVHGVQSMGVGTSLKHYAANNQETDRMRRDSQVDERTLRELYLAAFERVVRQAQPWTVMAAYNRVNGVRATEHHQLLTEILRGEWGFEGAVVSDWGAVVDPVAALRAGLDLEMPPRVGHSDIIRRAIDDGDIDERTVATAYSRLEKVLRRAAEVHSVDAGFDADAHHALARTAAEQAIVLLENDGILPLSPSEKIAVIGEFARTPRYQGAGSSRVRPTRLDSALLAIEAHLGHPVDFAPGFATDPNHAVDAHAHSDAVALAESADVVVLFLGLGEEHESEGYDRESMDLPEEQLRLLDDILLVNANVVVVLSNGSSVLVTQFATRVRAVVEAWLLGQAGGPAIADVLFGAANPSGKLAETIPLCLEDVPSFLHFPGDMEGVRYGEGLFVGYRGYDARNTAVAYPFGHGLSYTTFDYSDLTVGLVDHELVVEVTIANTGGRAGREVVQVYVARPDSHVVRAPRELKGFSDVHLEPKTSERLRISIPTEDLAHWDVRAHRWRLEGGVLDVSVGASSRDLRLAERIVLPDGESAPELTLQSTVAEALAVPAFAEGVARSGSGLIAAAADNRMLADIPLLAMAIFSGQPPEVFDELLEHANRALAP